MKAKLLCPFTDSQPGLAEALVAGDEIEITRIEQRCPDLGCCEVRVIFTHPDIGCGWGNIYFDRLSSEGDLRELLMRATGVGPACEA